MDALKRKGEGGKKGESGEGGNLNSPERKNLPHIHRGGFHCLLTPTHVRPQAHVPTSFSPGPFFRFRMEHNIAPLRKSNKPTTCHIHVDQRDTTLKGSIKGLKGQGESCRVFLK
jgi:hypothetical protein